MKIILIILFISIKAAYTRKCYTCSSKSDELCTEKQTVISCKNEEECVTMKYTKKHGEKRVYKFCQNKKVYCNKECSAPWSSGYKSCKASCCDSDYCNKPTVEKKAIIIKRNTKEIRNGASKPSQNTIFIVSYSLLMVMFVVWIH